MYLLCHRPTVDFVSWAWCSIQLQGITSSLCSLSVKVFLYIALIFSLPLSWSVSAVSLCCCLSSEGGSNFIYHLLCPVANTGSKNTLTRSQTQNVLFSCEHRCLKLRISLLPKSCQLFMVLLISCSWFYQSLFKTSHVTRRPSLKCLSGIQVQLLSLWMGKHQILQNRSLSLRLNFIFEITNEIGQQLCPKCCFFCSNSVIKSLFIRLDQPACMRSPERTSQSAECFYSNRDF